MMIFYEIPDFMHPILIQFKFLIVGWKFDDGTFKCISSHTKYKTIFKIKLYK